MKQMLLAAPVIAAFIALAPMKASAAADPRARDLGITFNGTPGPLNAITDVPGVEVGHVTVDAGKARTGVTVIHPLGRAGTEGVPAATFSFNGTGELTGAHLIDEYGALFSPIVLTGTASVGIASTGALQWASRRFAAHPILLARYLPVVGETMDSFLNDDFGFHVTTGHIAAALEGARSGPVAEGNVGGGTGMIVHEFKGGIGTASRAVEIGGERHIVGVLVQANYGSREELRIAGVPVGRELPDLRPVPAKGKQDDGSIIVVVATNAPLTADQLERVAKRPVIGLARNGGYGGTTSGDIFVAFSTANRVPFAAGKVLTLRSLPNEELNPLLLATADATEEAIINALVAARDMRGASGQKVFALPHRRLKSVLAKYRPGSKRR